MSSGLQQQAFSKKAVSWFRSMIRSVSVFVAYSNKLSVKSNSGVYFVVHPTFSKSNSPFRQDDSSRCEKMSFDKHSLISQQVLNESNHCVDESYSFDDYRLDAAHLMLYKDGRVVALKPKVVETLVALIEKRGEVISKDELMDRLWADSFVEESNLTQNIYLLRKTLGKCENGRPYIENFARRGYRFNGEVKLPASTELVFATQTRTQTVVEETTTENSSRRNWLISAIAAAGVIGVTAFVFTTIIPSRFSTANNISVVTPFESFKLKRHSDSNDITSAVISHDGKFIAYNGKQNSLWLKNTATGDDIKILPESGKFTRSVISFSPDDNHIYFFNISEDKKGRIAKMSVVGGSVEQIVVEDVWSDASLSPDGKHLSFIRNDNETGKQYLMIADANGTGERAAAASKEGMWFGLWSQSTAWSPDGSRIASTGGTTADGRSIWDIKIFSVAGGEEIATIKPGSDWSWIDAILWLPDGDNLLVIVGDHTAQGQIYKHTISTGEWKRVTNDLNNYVRLSVTADGKTVVTIQHENPGNLWLYPANGDTSQAKQITFGRNLMTDATGVSWTPDGKIVYATNTGSRWEIWMIDADGTNQKQLTQNCAGNDTCSQPVVSPDGRYIVFHATLGGVRNIWRMDIDGGNPTQLTTDGGYSPSISSDGRYVIYARYAPASMLWQVPIEGGKAELFSKITSIASAAFSPDGKYMAFGHYDKKAKQPFQTCVARVEADSPEKCFGISRSFPRWTEDGKAFYYLDHSYLGIWKQPLDGERELFFEFPGERTNNFAFSQDRKSLVVARSKPTQDIVALTDER